MRETVTISLPKAVRQELDRVAKQEGVSRSDVLRQSLEEFLFARRFRAPQQDDGRGPSTGRLHRRGYLRAYFVRLAFDTNVLVAALIARGTCADLLEHCARNDTIVTSESILNELADVLVRKFRQRDSDARAARRLFSDAFIVVTPQTLEQPASRDLDDDVVLAITGECSAIVTGDHDLLTLDPYGTIRVLSASAFWKWEAETRT
jgi:putative PIN family toxin of toxin-antitoxin system